MQTYQTHLLLQRHSRPKSISHPVASKASPDIHCPPLPLALLEFLYIPIPLKARPAANELLGIGGVPAEPVLEPLSIPGVFVGQGVNGVENGWAADVDVAGGGDKGESCRWAVENARFVA